MKSNHLSKHTIKAILNRYGGFSTDVHPDSERKIENIQKIERTHDLDEKTKTVLEKKKVNIGNSEDHHRLLDSGDHDRFLLNHMLYVHNCRRRGLKSRGRIEPPKNYDDSVTDRILNMHLYGEGKEDRHVRRMVYYLGSEKHKALLRVKHPGIERE